MNVLIWRSSPQVEEDAEESDEAGQEEISKTAARNTQDFQAKRCFHIFLSNDGRYRTEIKESLGWSARQ